ncbi:hypocretin neuropeptide precursor [Brachionichthys hirsutus]|uniref:hypocretin neuropeptide precursor n=1 Tax=Brachionichthys hirsutus TaxID=412623 RepID=UPI0036045038
MTWFHANSPRDSRMPQRKLLPLVVMLLLSPVACDDRTVSECCCQSPRSCRLYVLLCHSDRNASGPPLTGDAAAGILTLGKRREEEDHLQSRLHLLLNGSRNQAAGILTMGKRTGKRDGERRHMERMSRWRSSAPLAVSS